MTNLPVCCAAVVFAAIATLAAGETPVEPTKDVLLADLRRQIEGREEEPAEAVFKDIEVMKGRTAGQLLAVMDLGYSRSLGVECSHCHDIRDWAADAKEQKQVSREMTLMAREINAKLKTIEGIESETPVINCTTCHRGHKKPAINLD